MKELRGKVAVVTGARGGLGAAIAERLRSEGCRLVLVDVRTGPRVQALDVADARAWDALAERLRDEYGGIDLLVNNAGLTVHGVFADQSRDDLDHIVDVNLKGVLHGCRAFLPQLRAREGHIVNVSSLAGQVAFPYQSTYCATKFAVRGFSAALRIELAPYGVGVTAMLPGAVATGLLAAAQSYDRASSQKLAALMLEHGVAPARVADRMVRAIVGNEGEVLIGWDARIASAAAWLAPSLFHGALAAAFRARINRS